MIKAVLFDYDGVLSATTNKRPISDALTAIYGSYAGWEHIADLHQALSCNQITASRFFRELAKRHGSNTVLTANEWHNAFPDIFKRCAPVYGLAAALRKKGIRTGVLSNMYAMTAVELRKLHNYDGFDPIVLSCEVGHVKPEPEIYQYALRELGLKSSEVLFVDDREQCLVPARELGMYTVLATDPGQIVSDVAAVIKQENRVEL